MSIGVSSSVMMGACSASCSSGRPVVLSTVLLPLDDLRVRAGRLQRGCRRVSLGLTALTCQNGPSKTKRTHCAYLQSSTDYCIPSSETLVADGVDLTIHGYAVSIHTKQLAVTSRT